MNGDITLEALRRCQRAFRTLRFPVIFQANTGRLAPECLNNYVFYWS